MILTLSKCRSISSHTKFIILISNMQNCDFSSNIITFERFISINTLFKFWMCRNTKMRISDTTFLFSWSFRFLLTTTSFTNVWHFFEIWAFRIWFAIRTNCSTELIAFWEKMIMRNNSKEIMNAIKFRFRLSKNN